MRCFCLLVADDNIIANPCGVQWVPGGVLSNESDALGGWVTEIPVAGTTTGTSDPAVHALKIYR